MFVYLLDALRPVCWTTDSLTAPTARPQCLMTVSPCGLHLIKTPQSFSVAMAFPLGIAYLINTDRDEQCSDQQLQAIHARFLCVLWRCPCKWSTKRGAVTIKNITFASMLLFLCCFFIHSCMHDKGDTVVGGSSCACAIMSNLKHRLWASAWLNIHVIVDVDYFLTIITLSPAFFCISLCS